MKVRLDCNCAPKKTEVKNCEEEVLNLKAEVSQQGTVALMDAGACWCYITTKCRGLLESPDASLMSDAMLESSREKRGNASKIAKMGHQDVFGLLRLSCIQSPFPG